MSKKENIPVMNNTVLVFDYDIQHLEGKLLTLIDAISSNPEQRKATKDLVKEAVWGWRRHLKELESEGSDSPNYKIVN